MLIGYLENLGSDRRIINTVSMRLDILFFVGYDIGEPLPWHSTLSRTRQLYGDDLFKRLFKQVLKQCINKGMVAGRRQVMASVAVKASASMDSFVEKEVLDDSDDYTDELNTTDEDHTKTVSPKETKLYSFIISGKPKPIRICPKEVPSGRNVPNLSATIPITARPILMHE